MAILININAKHFAIINHAEEAGQRAKETKQECLPPERISKWDDNADADVMTLLTPEDKELWTIGYLSGKHGFDIEY